MEQSDASQAQSRSAVAPRPHRFVRRLSWLYAVVTLIVALLLSMQLLPGNVMPGFKILAGEAAAGGLGAMVMSALLLALTGLLATLALTTARYRHTDAVSLRGTEAARAQRRGLLSRLDPRICRPPEARLSSSRWVAALTYLAAVLLWPRGNAAAVPANASVVAAFVFALAFVSFVAERTMNAFPEPQLPGGAVAAAAVVADHSAAVRRRLRRTRAKLQSRLGSVAGVHSDLPALSGRVGACCARAGAHVSARTRRRVRQSGHHKHF